MTTPKSAGLGEEGGNISRGKRLGLILALRMREESLSADLFLSFDPYKLSTCGLNPGSACSPRRCSVTPPMGGGRELEE